MVLTQGLWQHRNCNDLQLQILKVRYRGSKYTVVKALYIRKDFGCGSLVLDTKADTLTITKDQYHNWNKIKES